MNLSILEAKVNLNICTQDYIGSIVFLSMLGNEVVHHTYAQDHL